MNHGYWGKEIVLEVGDLDVSGSNEVSIAFGRPVDVKRVIMVTTTALTAADAELTVGWRKVDDTGSEDHSTWTLVQEDSALNDVSEILLAESKADDAGTTGVDDSTVHTAGDDLIHVDSDEEFFIESDGGPDAGDVKVFVQVQEKGVQPTRFSATALEKV